ncbi:type II secretion system minor pseudopilin GspJ [Vibrio alginolyticus]|jgi:general secretion pathway protein J|uniref:type II secretion system minor pseudopilin GspJ n=1 Tax=Vibrio TaxID=662 RepID=UPI0001BDEF4F|nr:MULTISPECIES: type II secretion system minor pseudopilin GspJ [Vibrio]EEZ84956.1 General secretion pathway protein J precursor [Vibrio alginolyticus 40B]EGQ7762884.1 type II secretion system minor pseudopilin GspJ [Vibrio alginolyticus]EGQ7841261.1 type II secretion system minor pseudopilin GspJ [Vibrio alginolyticus]EGQ7903549.1 type II secretion system minor pseudopilin GspJ [Vibrio alginolyticus]EGQ8983245.1 type II secretion system protein GspJ [Vibrio alginolyticus]
MWRNNHPRANTRQRVKGFTLIEVLVSIAIFASLSVAAYQVVSQVQRSNALSQERTQRLNEIQRAMVMMDNDFRQMAMRQTRTNGEEPASRLIFWSDYLLDSDTKGLMFARLGWHNPQQQFPRGEVTKVGYRLKEETLQRVWWRYPDTPVGQQGTVTPLLTQVESFDMRFYDGKQWKKEWAEEKALPKAVSVVLTLKDYGEIVRTYLTPDGTLSQKEESSGDSNNG